MRAEPLEILAKMTRDLVDVHSLEAGLKKVTDTALQVIDADHASVRLCGDGGLLSVGARSGRGSDGPAPVFHKGEGLMGWVAETGEVVRLGDGPGDPRFRAVPNRGFDVSSVMAAPIRTQGTTVGVLSLSAARTDAFDDVDEAVCVLLAGAAAQALRTAELEALAATDSTTLAYNRRCLLPRLREEMERAARHGDALSVLLIDLDHFKAVNDRHGHASGDAALRAFADEVRDCVRSVDILVRRGGEEFVLIMPSTDADQAHAVAERIRARLDDSPLQIRHGMRLRQTVSIGVAIWNGSESPESLDERADQAMYDAKRHGRNRVVVAERMSGIRAVQTVPPAHPKRRVG